MSVCMQWLYFAIQGFGSDELGCSKYNCTHRGSLLIDLIGVSSGGCCHCLVSVGIHSFFFKKKKRLRGLAPILTIKEKQNPGHNSEMQQAPKKFNQA